MGMLAYQTSVFGQGAPTVLDTRVERTWLDEFTWVDHAHTWLAGADELLADLAHALQAVFAPILAELAPLVQRLACRRAAALLHFARCGCASMAVLGRVQWTRSALPVRVALGHLYFFVLNAAMLTLCCAMCA